MQFNGLPDSSCSRLCVLIASIDASVFSIEKSFVQRLTVSTLRRRYAIEFVTPRFIRFLVARKFDRIRNVILRLKRAKSPSEIVVEAYLILFYDARLMARRPIADQHSTVVFRWLIFITFN